MLHTNFKSILIFLVFSIFAVENCNSQCSTYQYDRGDHLADKFGDNYVTEAFGAGDNVSVDVTDCRYNSYSKELILDVSITFNGIFFSSNYYVIQGEFKISDNNELREFEVKYVNDRAKKTLSNIKWMAGAAVIYNLD